MAPYDFKPWHLYKIRCEVQKPFNEGGDNHQKWKFWFALVPDEQPTGFFVNSEKRYNPLQMKIQPDDINRHLPKDASKHHRLTHESFINFSPKKFKSHEIYKVEKILNTMPSSLARKIMQFLQTYKDDVSNHLMKMIEKDLKKYLP